MKAIIFLALFFFYSPSIFSQGSAVVKDTLLQGNLKNNNTGVLNATEKINPFIIHTGKTIRSVSIKTLGFEMNINDTSSTHKSFGAEAANTLHRNTSVKVIKNNLLFAAGDKINPYLLADNEQHLRNLVYIQDALIVVERIKNATDSVDIVVLVKDVFPLDMGMGIGNTKKYKLELKNENVAGTGSRIAISSLWDDKRKPRFGFGAEFLQRNIRGSFINWGIGFKNYNNAFNSNRNEEIIYYTRFEKPLVSQYLRWIGSLDLSYNKTSNVYLTDSVYRSDFKYSYYNIDGWAAYNIGAGKLRYKKLKSSTQKLIGGRIFHQRFNDIPEKSSINYDGTYSNVSGLLGSLSIFKQNYYRATYIYGFGRNEDVPEGFSTSFIGGYTIRKDSLYDKTRLRPYYGVEALTGNYNRKGFYSAYTFRLGGNHYNGKWEDVTLLLNAEHFTRLKKISSKWYRRVFLNGGFTKQFVPVLDQPLILRSPYGLPYFEYGYINADMRTTLKSEIVFYRTKKFSGFGFAPFAFADMSLLKPTKESFSKSDLYSSIGGGFRIRNENIILGTMELRASYFPRILPNMNHLKIKINTNLRYKYNSSFIRRPDFVAAN